MKCGTEMKNDGVFCEECLADMEHYPVKPNVTVTLPPQTLANPPKRRTRRTRYVKPEDQIRHLKKVRNWLFVLLLSALLALAITIAAFLRFNENFEQLPIGRSGESTSETN